MLTRLTERWHGQLQSRRQTHTLRTLPQMRPHGIDFASNDYLGLAREPLPAEIFEGPQFSGATGSRLLTGNREATEILEAQLATYLEGESALLFTSGYALNSGLFSALCQPADILLVDECAHASLKAGCRLSRASLYYFRHNELTHLQIKLARLHAGRKPHQAIFVVVESLYSMDGDVAPLAEMVELAESYSAHVVVDEAHALGTLGSGRGVSIDAGVASRCLARIYAFGKAMGCQGAAVVGSSLLRDMIVNFCPSFLYTTAQSPVLQTLLLYRLQQLQIETHRIAQLQSMLTYAQVKTPIVGFRPPKTGVSVQALSQQAHRGGFWVLPIVSPTVQRGTERIRICLHADHTQKQIDGLWQILGIERNL
jgi:8-amino-7-oxononanoate synthase